MNALADLSLTDVQAKLKTHRFGRSLEIKATTTSTNDDARAATLRGVPNGHVIVADAQTRGRGARGRIWDSPAGLDLYVSIVAEVPVPLEHLPPLTLAVGLGVADTVDECLPPPLRARVKWPNDVWIDGKKCAGVLVESASQGDKALPLVIGIGLNVNRRAFPEGLAIAPTSLALSVGREYARANVLAALLQHVEARIDRFRAEGPAPLVAELDGRLALRGARASCEGVEGTVLGVAPSGALRLQTDEGVVELLSGTLRPLHG